MKKLITLISTKGKTSEQVSQEAHQAVLKYQKVHKKSLRLLKKHKKVKKEL